MERINGRQAVSVLAEYKADKRELSDEELNYVESQIDSFVVWLAEKADLTVDEATDRMKNMITSEVRLLLQDDPYQEFLWSRGDEVGELEISGGFGEDFEQTSDNEHFSSQAYWANMERIAEQNVGKYPDEVWAASRELMEKICETLNSIKYGKQLPTDPKVNKYLQKVNKRINDLRFGTKTRIGKVEVTRGGGQLLNKHWKICKNICNELLGNPKRYTIKVVEEKTEEEKVDAMDNAVYGFFDSNQLYK